MCQASRFGHHLIADNAASSDQDEQGVEQPNQNDPAADKAADVGELR